MQFVRMVKIACTGRPAVSEGCPERMQPPPGDSSRSIQLQRHYPSASWAGHVGVGRNAVPSTTTCVVHRHGRVRRPPGGERPRGMGMERRRTAFAPCPSTGGALGLGLRCHDSAPQGAVGGPVFRAPPAGRGAYSAHPRLCRGVGRSLMGLGVDVKQPADVAGIPAGASLRIPPKRALLTRAFAGS